MQIYAMIESTLAAYLDATMNATTEERTAAFDRFGNQSAPDIFAVSEDGTEASISITGVLSQDGPSPIARFFGFGGTGYRDIIAAAELIADDSRIKTVRLRMNTPGGSVDGMDQAREAIRALAKSKTVIAENHGLIASAGYYLATAANKIVSMSPLAQTGSIGVVIGGLDASKAMEAAGVKRIKIISRNAPDKQPDPTTKHGESVLQAEADAVERVFLQKVAEGRSTTVENVISNFGRGGVLIAQDPDPSMPDALKSGMIDEIISGSSGLSGEYGDILAGPTTFKDFPIADRPWDGAEAEKRVRRFVGAESAPNQRYRQAFFWYDSENEGNFTAYKMPFVDVVDGQLTAIINGVNAADGAMSGARGQRVQIPAADRPRVQNHIDRYKEKWKRQKENGNNAIGGGNPVTAEKSAQNKESKMDLKQLKQDHPAVFAEAVAAGVAQERDRVQAHITMGTASGDMDYAVKCVNEGLEFTATVQAKYLAAGLNRNDAEARAGEGDAAAKATAAAAAEKSADAISEEAMTIIEKAMGVNHA